MPISSSVHPDASMRIVIVKKETLKKLPQSLKVVAATTEVASEEVLQAAAIKEEVAGTMVDNK